MNHPPIRGGIAAALTAAALLLGATTPATASEAPPASEQDWSAFCRSAVYGGEPYDTTFSATTQCRIQGGPANSGGYKGPVDGAMGTASWAGFQTYLRHHGYTGPTDGVPGPATYRAVQQFARTGGYTGPIDGVMGPNSWSAVNRAIRIGWFGPLEAGSGETTPTRGEG